MGGVEVRGVELSDLEAVNRIERLSFPDPYPWRLLYRLILFSPKTFLVATIEGRLVGYVSAVVEEGGVGHILSIATHHDFRRKDVARRLLEHLLPILEGRGVRVVRLEVRRGNRAAQNLYLTLGFKETGTVEGYYGGGEDGLLFERPLRG